jgi:hypothetical protein
MKTAIYSDNNGSPGSLLVGSNELTSPSSGWVTFALTKEQPITAGTYYWLAVCQMTAIRQDALAEAPEDTLLKRMGLGRVH